MYKDILMQNGSVCRYHAKVANNLESATLAHNLYFRVST
jgi:hypothetical protein